MDDLTIWMVQRKLARPRAKTTSAMFETALSLRASLQDYLQHDFGGTAQQERNARAKRGDCWQLAFRPFQLRAENGPAI